MLVLTRKLGGEIFLNDDIRIIIKEIRGKQVRIGIEAPPSVPVYRGEIYRRILEENRRAALVQLEDASAAAEALKKYSEKKATDSGEEE